MLPVKRNNLISSFLICISFVSFSCLVVLAKTLIPIVNKNRQIGHFCLTSDF